MFESKMLKRNLPAYDKSPVERVVLKSKWNSSSYEAAKESNGISNEKKSLPVKVNSWLEVGGFTKKNL